MDIILPSRRPGLPGRIGIRLKPTDDEGYLLSMLLDEGPIPVGIGSLFYQEKELKPLLAPGGMTAFFISKNGWGGDRSGRQTWLSAIFVVGFLHEWEFGVTDLSRDF